MEIGAFYSKIKDAVAGNHVAIRVATRLSPVGGPHTKIFPATYEGGKYAFEERRVDGVTVRTVLLDSVQSQANRMEKALLEAYPNRIKFPFAEVDFSGINEGELSERLKKRGIEKLTSLEVPHRLADAIILDTMLDGQEFLESPEGQALESASVNNATPLFELSPTSLIFGQWLSHDRRASNRFQRSIVSEIVGYNAVQGIRTGGRLDPLPISASVKLRRTDATAERNWEVIPRPVDVAAEDVESGEEEGGKKGMKASELGLGNVTPSFKNYETKEDIPGGVTVDYAEQVGVLSLISLRRLKFPLGGKASPDADKAARVALASLALVGMALQIEGGFELRSRCSMCSNGKPKWELVSYDGATETFDLGSNLAIELYNQSLVDAEKAHLPWRKEPLRLRPADRLVDLVSKSLALREEIEPEVE